MGKRLEGKRVAFVVTDGFEQSELTGPLEALRREGAACDVISPKDEKVRGWQHHDWGDEIDVDVPLREADPGAYDALVLPGGQMNPDVLRTIPAVLTFVREFFEAGKIVGAICHGPWTLIDAGCASGRTLTSWPSLRTDLSNAGANWVDAEVVVDDGLVSSRNPGDIPAFSDTLIEEISRERGAAPRVPRSERGEARPG